MSKNEYQTYAMLRITDFVICAIGYIMVCAIFQLSLNCMVTPCYSILKLWFSCCSPFTPLILYGSK